MLGEGSARARALPRPRAGRACRRSPTPSSSARSSSSRARGTTRCATRWSSASAPPRARLLCSIWAGHLPEHYKGYTAPATGAMDIALLEQLAEDGPFLVSLQPLQRAHARRALRARAEGRAGRRAADARGPRAARDRGDLDAAGRRRRDVGAGVPRARPRRRAAGHRARSATAVAELLAAVHRGDAETDNLNRLVITAGLDRRQVAILRAYRKYRQRVGSRFTESYQNDVLVANSAVTAKLVRYFELRFDPDARDRRGRRGRAARRDPRRPRRGRLARPRPDPAQPADGDRGDAAHQRLQRGARGAGVQAALRRRAGDAAAGAVRRDLRLLARGRGHPPARRADRPRRPALVGPPGLPHRGLRADARAADQERRDRARGREGRLLPQARRRRDVPRSSAVRHLHPLAAVA